MKTKSKLKAIIFDMGGVILDLTAKETLKVPNALSVMFDISIKKTSEIWKNHWREIVTGKETPREFLVKLSTLIKTDKSTDELLSEWTKLSMKDEKCINWTLLDYIVKLKKHYKVYVLTDALGIAQDDNLTINIKSRFDGYYVSYEEGVCKPDDKAFRNILRKINFKAKECIFVDDVILNTEAATMLGLTSILYVDFMQFKKELTKLAIV